MLCAVPLVPVTTFGPGEVPGAPAECVALAAEPIALEAGRNGRNGFRLLRQESRHQPTLMHAVAMVGLLRNTKIVPMVVRFGCYQVCI